MGTFKMDYGKWASFAQSTGTLITFCGITYALMEFDVNNIDDSVPLLLTGMKTAFISSVVGMSASILLRLKIKNESSTDLTLDLQPEVSEKNDDDKRHKESMNKLGEFAANQNEQGVKQLEILKELAKSLTDSARKQEEMGKEQLKKLEEIGKSSALADEFSKSIKSAMDVLNEQIDEKLTKTIGALTGTTDKLAVATEKLSNSYDENRSYLEELDKSNKKMKDEIVSSTKAAKTAVKDMTSEVEKKLETSLNNQTNMCAKGMKETGDKIVGVALAVIEKIEDEHKKD